MEHDECGDGWRPPRRKLSRWAALAAVPVLGLLMAVGSVFTSAGSASAQQTPATVVFCFQGQTLTLPTAQVLAPGGGFLPAYAGATLGPCAVAASPTATPTTAAPTATPTSAPPTATPTTAPPTATPTSVPQTATPTSVPPTSTPTSVPQQTQQPAVTEPSATATATTAAPAATPTATATSPADQGTNPNLRIFSAPQTIPTEPAEVIEEELTEEEETPVTALSLLLNPQSSDNDENGERHGGSWFNWKDYCDDEPNEPQSMLNGSYDDKCEEPDYCDEPNGPVAMLNGSYGDKCNEHDPCRDVNPLFYGNKDHCFDPCERDRPHTYGYRHDYDKCEEPEVEFCGPLVAHVFEYERAARECKPEYPPSCDHQSLWQNPGYDHHKIAWNDAWWAHCKVNFCTDGVWTAHHVDWRNWQAHCKVDFCRYDGHAPMNMSWERRDHCKVDFCERGWNSWQMAWSDWSYHCKVDFCIDHHWDSHKMAWNDWRDRCKVDFCRVDHHDFDKQSEWKDDWRTGWHVDDSRHGDWKDDDRHGKDDDWKHRFDKDDKVHQICVQPQVTVIINLIVKPQVVTHTTVVAPAPVVVSASAPAPIVTFAKPQTLVVASTNVAPTSIISPPSTGDAGMASPVSNESAPLAPAGAALLVAAIAMGALRRLLRSQ